MSSRRQVRCLETGKVYDTLRQAAKENGTTQTSIWRCCTGKLYTAAGLHWKYASETLPRFERLYTVYDNRTDLPVIVDGTSREAAKAMGIGYGSFHPAVTRFRNGTSKRWHIEVRDAAEVEP